MNKANLFLAFTAAFPCIFLSNLFIAFEVILLTNQGKLTVVKGIATFVTAFLPKLLNQKPNDSRD